jgi:pimeloyl-ACP methyl ester carboxylesterase
VPEDRFVDLAPADRAWGHGEVADRDGHRVHYVRRGAGAPVVLLHGWPGFWYDYRRVLPAFARDEADVVAVDLRGFGASDKPDLPPEAGYGRAAQAAVVLALLEALGLPPAVLVGYDIGSAVAQEVTRAAPDRVRGLVLGAPMHPGSGARALQPAHQREFWYQDFHRLPLATALAGRDRASVRAYLAHFYDHWAGRKEAVRPAEFEAIVDTYAAPGALDVSLAWYRSGAGTVETARRAVRTAVPDPPAIAHRAEILWGALDPLFPPAWAEGLERSFAAYRLTVVAGAGHFLPFEAPDEVVRAVRALL